MTAALKPPTPKDNAMELRISVSSPNKKVMSNLKQPNSIKMKPSPAKPGKVQSITPTNSNPKSMAFSAAVKK